MDLRVNALIGILLALGLGVAVTWVVSRARQRASQATAQAEFGRTISSLQIELNSATERAAPLFRLHQELQETTTELNGLRVRRATLESELQRMPDLEQRLAAVSEALEQAREQSANLREQSGKESAELLSEREVSRQLRSELTEIKSSLANKTSEAEALAVEAAGLRKTLEGDQRASQEKLAQLLDAKQVLADQFKSIANDILDEKTKKFTEQNQSNLSALLDPLKVRLADFQAKVEQTHIDDTKERSTLGEQVRQLAVLNQTLSEDAKNLTRALRGSGKTQGTWGERILEHVLEGSGLRKGEEYIVQASHTREEGTRALPDVIIKLPEGRSLVVDSKVSLGAYEEFATTEIGEERTVAGKRHVDSLKGHIRGLADKNYQSLYNLNTLDFVVLFVPIEPAFMLAASLDRDLFMDAWNRNVLLVSPSTLLFVVRTVAHLWRQEAQWRNAQDIAKRGAELYDKFVGFVADMSTLGNRLTQAQTEYDDAFRKLSRGRGNLVAHAEKLRDLGVKPTKALPTALVEAALDESDDLEASARPTRSPAL